MNWHALSLSVLYVLRDWFLNPLLYGGFALAFWDLRRTSTFERKFFGIRATRALMATVIRGLQGLGVGLGVSVFFVLSGTTVELWEIAVVTALTIVLALARFRYLSPSYAIALLMSAAFVIREWTPGWTGWMAQASKHLLVFHTTSWMLILAGALIAEAWLVGIRRRRAHAPIILLSKRGRGIGALWTQLAFLVPFVVPVTGGLWSAPAYAVGGLHAVWVSGAGSFALAGVPCLVGFSGVFHAMQPKRAVRQVAVLNIVAAVVLIGAVVASKLMGWSPLWWTVWIVVVLREGLLIGLARSQSQRDPLFAPTDEGVTILSVLPGSLADTLGLQAGERIVEVNEIPVHSPYDVHFALNRNPAYARLRILDHRREIRLTGHTVYEGERAQLGLIFAPDEQTEQSVVRARFGLFESLYAHVRHLSRDVRTTNSLSGTLPPQLSEVAASREDPR